MITGQGVSFIKSLPLGTLIICTEKTSFYQEGFIGKVVHFPDYGNAVLDVRLEDVGSATTGHATNWGVLNIDFALEDFL